MAKSRKKKKTALNLPCSYGITKTYFDHYSTVVRKLLQQFDYDPIKFDEFTKKQKLEMMQVRLLRPRVCVEFNHHVPRQYIIFIKKEVNDFLKEYMGDESLKMTFEEYFTIGLSFLSRVCMLYNKLGENASEFVKELAEAIIKIEEETSLVDSVVSFVQIKLFEVSKINIRLYGVKWGSEIESPYTIAGYLYITSMAPECVNFTYHNKSRPAYRLASGSKWIDHPIWFTVPYNAVIPGSKNESPLKIYVQNHALIRVKERLDTLIPFNRNAAIMSSLVENKMVKTKSGRLLFSFIDSEKRLFGYMPFTIEGDSLFVLTFLPLASPETPEGNKLCELLSITKEDMIFLGMDKLSFYQRIDFNAIPVLKQGLIDAGMWHLTEVEVDEKHTIFANDKITGIVARFFQEKESEQTYEEVLSEMEGKY